MPVSVLQLACSLFTRAIRQAFNFARSLGKKPCCNQANYASERKENGFDTGIDEWTPALRSRRPESLVMTLV